MANSFGIAGYVLQCSFDVIDFNKDAPIGSLRIDMKEVLESVLSASTGIDMGTVAHSEDDDIFEMFSVQSAIAAIDTVRKYTI
jgi:hypothetical protein